MQNMIEFLHIAEALVNELSEQLDADNLTLLDAEKQIVNFVNRIGNLIFEEVITKVKEPTVENTLWVEGKKAVYKQTDNLRIKTRFGGEIVRQRRTYKIQGEKGNYCPLDEKLGMNKCGRYSPLMTYLLSFFGGCEAYGPSSKKVSAALGFSVSSTAIQNNTEKTGRWLEHHPYRAIPDKKQSESCDLMIVEADGTMSPRIHEEEGITGRESLKQPTEYKECNLVAIEKRTNGECIDRWVGAQYGERKNFSRYVNQTGMKMGQLQAKKVAFIADGAKHNWEIQQDNFPGSIGVLDYFHALEHLAAFCELYKKGELGKQAYANWSAMLYEGRILEVLEDMRSVLYRKISDPDAGVKHINYYSNNKSRMEYDLYRKQGIPIGSGFVEGQCKLVVNRRFKGNGMRWKSADNEAVLDVRLAILNGRLEESFRPKTRKFDLVSGL